MTDVRDQVWSLAFAVAVAVLMLAILLMRSVPVPVWVMIVYPGAGGVLAHMASRTSPTAAQMATIESGAIAAAAIIVLAALVNMLLADMLLREMRTGEMLGSGSGTVFFGLPAAAAALWWALQRRLARLRRESVGRRVEEPRHRDDGRHVIPAE